ncbi:ubiquitin conjugation factor E4 A [Diachasma alloeum]|uniref:ubiquitin conjugation factor E4 A n=1 Tax=Diachasma alloeum TaxID=454923 RepID=UPI0007382FE1|nr:ubiquitin conjugation factor E4 A [Diachasma alloeum]
MCENVNSNPFAGLFSTSTEAESFSQAQNPPNPPSLSLPNGLDPPTTSPDPSCTSSALDKHIQSIFGLLLTKRTPQTRSQLISIDAETIDDGLFERLTFPDIESKLVPPLGTKGVTLDPHFVQPEIIPYLFECWSRLQRLKHQEKDDSGINDVISLENVVLRSVGTALEAPDIFQEQDIHRQYLELFVDSSEASNVNLFTENVVNMIKNDEESDDQVLLGAFGPMLNIIHKEAADSNLLVFRQHWFNVLQVFSNVESLAKLLIRHCTPIADHGSAFSDTIFGALLSLSCLPKSYGGPYDFFDKPLVQQPGSVEGNIWTALDALSENLHKIFHSLLKCSPETRHLTLKWIARCLKANSARGKIWNTQGNVGGALTASDGFMLNLGNVLLRLCQPFCLKYTDPKILKIDPTYCAAEPLNEEDSKTRGVHMEGMSRETCLIPPSENETRPVAKTFTFVTECFFLTHCSLDLGYRVVLEKLMKTNQDLSRIQRVYNDAQSGGSSEVFDVITQRMEMEMTKYLSLRASLLAPEMLKLLAKFHAATAHWLMQVNVNLALDENQGTFAPMKPLKITFPLPETVPDTLKCIPEFVVENTMRFVCFLRRLSPNTFEEHGADFLEPILTEIVGLMESPQRLYNPHLRAHLAEGLEALLPTQEDGNNHLQATLGTFHRQQLFVQHPHRKEIVRNLLQVFVSIEMTGQSVQFEQKFNYRRPMYIVMDYLWKIEEHRRNFKRLAIEAEDNMETVQPPLFLRFINLLMNDAVFLLDEALSNMAKLKTMLNARENGEWDKLPQHERDQQVGYLQHIGMTARFDNILGRETIATLKMLTCEIKSIFCHSTMVDRIASMLNYLLLQLVGPNKRNLKVKDQKEYEFNPANLVLNICEIYINLGENENFTLAVSQDGRSYRPDLFKLADNVLVRIGGVGILGDLENFSKRVAEAAHIKREEEEILTDAPDEFLDPIMSTLMTDPVILPSSKISVDRQTIARHLLSDQTDPFNRSPLTMDLVKSDTDLKNKIQEWIASKKQSRSS